MGVRYTGGGWSRSQGGGGGQRTKEATTISSVTIVLLISIRGCRSSVMVELTRINETELCAPPHYLESPCPHISVTHFACSAKLYPSREGEVPVAYPLTGGPVRICVVRPRTPHLQTSGTVFPGGVLNLQKESTFN